MFGICRSRSLKVVNCAGQDRLSAEGNAAVDRYADAVAKLVESADNGSFQEKYAEHNKAGRLAGECMEKARKALALHRAMHQCEESDRFVIVAEQSSSSHLPVDCPISKVMPQYVARTNQRSSSQILVVDDYPDNHALIRIYLSDCNFVIDH